MTANKVTRNLVYEFYTNKKFRWQVFIDVHGNVTLHRYYNLAKRFYPVTFTQWVQLIRQNPGQTMKKRDYDRLLHSNFYRYYLEPVETHITVID